MLMQTNRRVLSKNFTTRGVRLSIFKQSSEERGLAYSDYRKVKGESEKTEYTNNDVEQMQTSWISEDSASGIINLENGQSQLLKCDERIGDIFTKKIRSTNKDKHNESILSKNSIKENDKTNSSCRDWEKLGTVSAQGNLGKEIIDIPVKDLATEMDTPTTKNTEMEEISLPDVYFANDKKDYNVGDRGGRGLIKIGKMRTEIFECSLSNNHNKQITYTSEILMGETTASKTGFREAEDNINHVKESTVGVLMQQEVQDKLNNIRENTLSKTFCLESNKKDCMTFGNLCSKNENSEKDTSENKSVEDDLARQNSSVPFTNNASIPFTSNFSSSFIDDSLRPVVNFISSKEPTTVTSGSLGSLKQTSSCTSAEDTNSGAKFFAGENVHSCSESSNAQLRKNFDEIPLPILLLTYKNHALDEFLLKMVQLFGMKSVIRIGGRSKEPKLDECNLSNQFRNILANRTNINDLFEDYFCIKGEINELQEKIDKNMILLRSATQLNKFSLLQLLDEKQIITLLQKSNLDKDEQCGLQFILDRLYNEGKSVKKYLLDLYKKINLKTKFTYLNFNLKKIWETALKDWLPPVPRIHQLREINRKYTKMIKAVQHEDYNKVPIEVEELSDADEDCIREEQEKRMSERINFLQTKKKARLKLMKPSDGIICELSDFPADLPGDYYFLKERELWQLDEIERIRFINLLLKAEVKKIKEQFESTLDDLYLKINEKKYLENQIKLDICKKRKIIGMTITGASINSELIQQLAPKIVIVEEAAEILEPSLIAALHEKTEHLILIGDHQQLRPKIETHELRKKFYFDLSLMERLISSGKIGFKTLQRQCRMRPEFSIMLRDIYPNLRDGESIVLNEDHEQHNCITKSMFFWTHNFFEKKSRSYINKEEAKLVVSLTIYLLGNKVSVDKISILAPYLGQTKILRQKLSQAKKNYPNLIPEVTPQVSTIDMFQGDENDFIIVSLVRSNKPTNKNNIGFMNEMNRRCVTQSRARRGMFFVGNGETYASSLTWLPLILKMKRKGCYGREIPIQCPKHRDLRITLVGDVETLNRYIDSPDLLCSLPCDEELPCGLHECQKLCLPLHNHQICTHIVSDKFPDCRHSIMRKCCEELRHLRCQAEIEFSFMCRHLGKRKCWEEYAIKTCEKDCEKMMDCNLHQCKKICGQKHSHLKCEEKVKFTIQRCRHTAIKQCYENPNSVLCQKMVKKRLPCNHTIRIECHKPLPTMCYEFVDYKFPDCSHPSPSKKLCSNEITDACSYRVKHVCQNCKRKSLNECGTSFICKYECLRKRKCGHQCENICSEDCEKGECQVCEEIEIKKFQKAAKRNMKKIREDLFHKRRQENLILKEINNEVNPAEYRKIECQLMTYFRCKQDLLPKLLKIEKVDNAGLERNFEKAKIRSLGTFVDDLFYECDDNNIEHITKNGFPLQENPTVGIHFFTQLAKGSNKQETQSPKKILLCKVLIGKSIRIDNKTKINTDRTGKRPYDSVYVMESNSGKSETCIIFSRNQLLPKYIIHYECVLIPTLTSLPDLKAAEGQITKISVEPSRNQNVSDSSQAHFMKAEAIFYRLQKMYGRQSSTLQIKSVDFIVYPNDFPLKMKFEEKKNELEKGNFTEEILAFHGTDISNVENILKTNLDPHRSPKHGLCYGKGCYFSEFPDFSRSYGNGLILFRVLPGKEFEDETTDETWVKKGYHSKKVRANKERYAEQIIIQDQSQFLPYCVYHFKYD